MKFALNGAVTIGTLDGANIEIRQEVGAENLFIFGHTTGELQQLREQRSYRPRDICAQDPRVKRVVDALATNLFSPDEPGLFTWIHRALLEDHDDYFHLADLPGYLTAQEAAGRAFNDQEAWAQMAMLNVARIGKFSSDRTVAEYASEIWNIAPA